mmetsp:Transcript_47010/g.54189  ORF Transcript_47010/g.54189 Transcript_47010/m.54189 type:complete len:189 (+) Transcript_47010:72-638(+)
MEGDKPTVYFVLGGPGAGKGTMCANLVEKYKFTHLSAGDLLRAEVKKGSELGNSIKELMDSGSLVPSEKLCELLKNAMKDSGWKGTFLIDGYPRNEGNVKAWDDMKLNEECNMKGLLYFECDEETLGARLTARGRHDDNPEVIKNRFRVYMKETKPVIDKFAAKNQCSTIDSRGDMDTVWGLVQKIFD